MRMKLLSPNARGVHPAKVLLEHLSTVVGDRGLSTYRKFLARSERDDASHLLLSRLPDDKLRDFFLWTKPDNPPMYFDLTLEKIALLELATETNIVIARRTRYDTFKIHDRRVYDEAEERRTRFFALSSPKGKEGRKCLELDEIVEDYNRLRSESPFINRKSELPVASCLAEKVADCLSLVGLVHEHGDWCRTTLSFALEAKRAGREFGRGFVLVAHVGGPIAVHSSAPKDQTFAVLGMAPSPGKRLRQLDVVCVAGDPLRPFVYVPNKEYAEWILNHESHARQRTPGRLLDLVAGTADDDDAEASRLEAAEAATAAAMAAGKTVVTAMTEDCDYTRTVARPQVGCRCEPCLGAASFEDVMSDRGPQKPYHIALGAAEHLSFLGLDSEDNLTRVLKACDWSVSSFDVEAANLTLDRRSMGADSDFDVGVVSQERLRGRVLGRQVPVMISWTDQRATEAGAEPWVHQYDSAGGEHEAMIAEFVEALLARKEETMAAKRELLAPLFAIVDALRRAHCAFYAFSPAPYDAEDVPARGSAVEKMLLEARREEEDRHDRATAASFDLSAVGLFGRSLERLVRTQILVGFNSSSYDLPILADMLVSYLKGRKAKVSMQREGTRIKSFSFCGCKVVDARKLLADGYSLSSFAKMVGLEEHKVRRRRRSVLPPSLLTSRSTRRESFRLTCCSRETARTFWPRGSCRPTRRSGDRG